MDNTYLFNYPFPHILELLVLPPLQTFELNLENEFTDRPKSLYKHIFYNIDRFLLKIFLTIMFH